METKHLIIGAAAIGAVGYLALRGKGKDDSGGTSEEEFKKAQAEIDKAKAAADAAATGSNPAMSGLRGVWLKGSPLRGRSLRGTENMAYLPEPSDLTVADAVSEYPAEFSDAAIAALVAVNDATVAVKQAQMGVKNDYIALLKSGRTADKWEIYMKYKSKIMYIDNMTKWYGELQNHPSTQVLFEQGWLKPHGVNEIRDLFLSEYVMNAFTRNDMIDLVGDSDGYYAFFKNIADQLIAIATGEREGAAPERVDYYAKFISAVYYGMQSEFYKSFGENRGISSKADVPGLVEAITVARLMFRLQELQMELDENLVAAYAIQQSSLRPDSAISIDERDMAKRELARVIAGGANSERQTEMAALLSQSSPEAELKMATQVADSIPDCVKNIPTSQVAGLARAVDTQSALAAARSDAARAESRELIRQMLAEQRR